MCQSLRQIIGIARTSAKGRSSVCYRSERRYRCRVTHPPNVGRKTRGTTHDGNYKCQWDIRILSISLNISLNSGGVVVSVPSKTVVPWLPLPITVDCTVSLANVIVPSAPRVGYATAPVAASTAGASFAEPSAPLPLPPLLLFMFPFADAAAAAAAAAADAAAAAAAATFFHSPIESF